MGRPEKSFYGHFSELFSKVFGGSPAKSKSGENYAPLRTVQLTPKGIRDGQQHNVIATGVTVTTDTVERPRYIWGVQAIADEIGATKRQAFYLLEKGLLPATKVGNRWVANAAKLHAAIDREAAA